MRPYRPLGRLARWAVASLVLGTATSAALAVTDALALFGALDGTLEEVVLWSWPLTLPPIIVFLWWFARAYRNIPAVGISPVRRSTTWVVVGWVLPPMLFVVPYWAMRDLHDAGDPAARGDAHWDERPAAPVVRRWWIPWLLSTITSFAATGAAFAADWEALDGQGAATRTYPPEVEALELATSALSVVAGVFAIPLVREITRRLEARSRS